MSELSEIDAALNAAGCPIGNEHKTYSKVERIAGLRVALDYAWRQLDELRKELAAKKEEPAKDDSLPSDPNSPYQCYWRDRAFRAEKEVQQVNGFREELRQKFNLQQAELARTKDSEQCWITNAKNFDAGRIKAEKERDEVVNLHNAAEQAIQNKLADVESQRDRLNTIAGQIVLKHNQGETITDHDFDELEAAHCALEK